MLISELIRIKRLEKKLTLVQLGKILNVNNTLISSWENAKAVPRPENILKLNKALEIDISIQSAGRGKNIEKLNSADIETPYYDVEFTSGVVELWNDQKVKPDSYIKHPFFNGCDIVVRNSGQSMAKLIAHGDAIGLVRIDNWREFLPLGEVYAIVTNNGFRMVKIITKGDTDDSYTLISKPSERKKDEYPPQQIPKKIILHIFKVQASSKLF